MDSNKIPARVFTDTEAYIASFGFKEEPPPSFGWKTALAVVVVTGSLLFAAVQYAHAATAQTAAMVAASTQYFSAVDSASISVTGDLTIEGWFKFTTTPGSNLNFDLVTKTDAANQRSYAFFLQNLGGTISLVLGLSSTGANNNSSGVTWTPSTGTWYHLAVTYLASTKAVNFYVNGVQQGATQTNTMAAIFNSTAELDIGNAVSGTDQNIDGRASNIRIWNVERSAANISANQCVTIGSGTNLQASWTLDNSLLDGSGNSNTLTNHNTATFSADVPSCLGAAAFQLWAQSLF